MYATAVLSLAGFRGSIRRSKSWSSIKQAHMPSKSAGWTYSLMEMTRRLGIAYCAGDSSYCSGKFETCVSLSSFMDFCDKFRCCIEPFGSSAVGCEACEIPILQMQLSFKVFGVLGWVLPFDEVNCAKDIYKLVIRRLNLGEAASYAL